MMRISRIEKSAVIILLTVIALMTGCSKQQERSLTEQLTEQYKYDSEGKLICKITPDSFKTEYKYNDRGLLTEVKYSGGRVRYGYDENGNRIWMGDETGTTEYYYDAFDHLVGVIWEHSPWRLIAYNYDPWGYPTYIAIFDLYLMEQDSVYGEMLRELKMRKIETAQRRQRRELVFQNIMAQLRKEDADRRRQWLEYEARYKHDVLGNITSIDTKWGSIKYSYHPEKGQLERQLPNGIVTRFIYSPDGLLKSLSHVSGMGKTIVEYRYDYNAAGKVLNTHELTNGIMRTTGYVWDTRGYLEELHLPDGNTIRYNYDAMGNRILKQDKTGALRYDYDRFGRLIRSGSFRYEWDRSGNLTCYVKGKQETRIRYDGRDLPILIKIPGAEIRYKWDGDGNLISRRVGREFTHYLPNPIAPLGFTLAEFDRYDNLTASYLYGDVLLGQQNKDGQMLYFLEDGFNSIRHITDMNGKIVEQRNYTPFGEPLNLKGDMISSFRTMGERFLPELNSYAIGTRLYQPSTGRYLTSGPSPGYLERFDSFNKHAHSCSGSGIFMEPRCNQTRKLRGQNVLVGGVTARTGELNQWARELGFDTGFGVNRNLDRCPVIVRGFFDSLWAAQEQVTGGSIFPRTKENLYNKLLDMKHIGTLELHSHGAITFGNLHREIDKALEDGKLSIEKVVFAGAYPNKKMTEVLAKRGIPFEIKTAMPYGSVAPYLDRYYDPIGVITIPNLELGGVIAPDGHPVIKWTVGGLGKIGAILSALPGIPGPYSFKAHSLDYIHRGEEKAESESYSEELGWRRSAPDSHRRRDKYAPFKYPPLLPPDGGGGSGAAVGVGFNDPFKYVENQIGGIELASAGELIGNIGNITGAVFDPEKQCLVLVGERDISLPAMRAQDLAIALVSVLGHTAQNLQFSLDPDDPRDPKGKWLKAVYIPEEIVAGTSFGKAMFKADWLLKQYSFGVQIDEDGKMQERKCFVPGFKSTVDLALGQADREYGKERWARFWIVSDDMELKEYGNSIQFSTAKMRVKAKKQVPDSSSRTGLRDVDSRDPVAMEFVELFTELYDEIAKESPEFERVRQLAKAVALAKWIKKMSIPVDVNWITKYANKRIETVAKITALSVEHEKETRRPYAAGGRTGVQIIKEYLYLFGGIDLTVNPRYISDDSTARSLEEAVRSKLRSGNVGPIFAVMHGGRSLQATVLPITKSGQAMWDNLPSGQTDGIAHEFNNRGKLIKSIDRAGNKTECVYDPNNGLKTIKISNSDGWNITGERNKNGSSWTVTSPQGRTLGYKYDGSGYLSEIELDGSDWANCRFDRQKREVTVRYDGYIERVTYDENGNIKRYQIRTDKGSGIGVPMVDVSYAEDGIRPVKITTAQAQIGYSYYPDGRTKEITHSSSISATYVYDGDRLAKLQINRQGERAEYWFNKDGLVRSRDLLGGTADYGYANGRLDLVTLGQYGKAEYDYDAQNRLRAIHLPDDSRIERTYTDEKGESSGQTEHLVQNITHRRPDVYNDRIKQAEENSDQNSVVLLIQRLEGQLYEKFGSIAEKTIKDDIENDLDIAFGKEVGDPEEAEQRLRTVFGDVVNDGRTVVVWTPDEQFGNKLSMFLNKHMGVRSVFTENIQRAHENLTRHKQVGGNTSLVLVDATMNKIQQEAIEEELSNISFPEGKVGHSMHDIPEESNVVVVVAENDPTDKVEFLTQLEDAGKSGILKDKFIVLQYCGDSRPEVAKTLIEYGAVGVFFYERKISVSAVRLILQEADKIIQENPQMKADEVFRESIRKAIEGIDSGQPEYDQYKNLKPQLEDMLDNSTLVNQPLKDYNEAIIASAAKSQCNISQLGA